MGGPASALAIEILVVDEDLSAVRAVNAFLRRRAAVHVASTLRDARRTLSSRATWDGAILGAALPDGSGLHLLPDLRARHPAIPIVVFARHLDAACARVAYLRDAGIVMKEPDVTATLVKFLDDVRRHQGEVARDLDAEIGAFATQHRLSAREAAVIAARAHGVERKHLAEFLEVAESTLKTLIHRLLRKCGEEGLDAIVGAIWRRSTGPTRREAGVRR